MKLRKTFYAAVFFSVGIAFALAEEPVVEDTFTETTYSSGYPVATDATKTYPLFFYNTAGNESGNVLPFDIAEMGGGGNDYAVDYKNDGTGLTPQPATSGIDGKDESQRIYDLSVSFYDSITDKIGFTAQDDRGNPLYFAEIIPESTDESQISDNELNSFLSFDKKVFTNSRSGAQAISKYYYIGTEKEEDPIILLSTMLAIPFALLCFTLCAGLLLIVFTTMKEDENA